MTGDRHLVLRRDLAELPRMTEWAAAFIARAGLSHALAFRIQLCLEEAVSNIIRHGIADGAPPEIRVALGEAGGAFVAEIEDEGRPFDPREVEPRPPAASLDEAAIGGLGIPLMRRFASALSYESVGACNRLTLRFLP